MHLIGPSFSAVHRQTTESRCMDAITPPSIKERPILFSAALVRAILEGRKTQTRRIIKGQPCLIDRIENPPKYAGAYFCGTLANIKPEKKPDGWWLRDYEGGACIGHCPYGQPGDRLWVRETWQVCPYGHGGGQDNFDIRYPADGASVFHELASDSERAKYLTRTYDTRPENLPSIHMPRWASRITLEIVSVRVERLQDISEEDAFAEGVETWSEPGVVHYNVAGERSFKSPEHAFCKLWSNLYGPSEWDANPWVWVVKFKRVDA